MQSSSIVIEEGVAFLLNQASRAVARDLQARLQPFGVTPPQFSVLTRLWDEDGLSLTLLAERAGFDAPTLTGILDRLERQELVERRRNPEDRRVVTAHVTARGVALRDALPDIAGASESTALAGLDDVEVARLREVLRRVLSNLGG